MYSKKGRIQIIQEDEIFLKPRGSEDSRSLGSLSTFSQMSPSKSQGPTLSPSVPGSGCVGPARVKNSTCSGTDSLIIKS